ncbi:MAG: DNA translocase FtsK 4TM domain-containing protein, partial [Arcobacter sp.]|nr:DNA translocase FtsK 4TM domain-containing protein [Arcobacter sp.]
MKLTMIISIIVLIYGAFSTLFHDTQIVGKVGKIVGETNIELFGYIAYINLLLLIFPLYKIYKNINLIKQADFIVGWILFFIGLFLFGGLVFSPDNAGYVGFSLVDFLVPYIGKLGLWLFWFMIMIISLILVVDDDFDWYEFFYKIKNKIMREEKRYNQKRDGFLKSFFTPFNIFFKKVGLKIKGVFKNPFAARDTNDNFMPLESVKSQKHTDENIISHSKEIKQQVEFKINSPFVEPSQSIDFPKMQDKAIDLSEPSRVVKSVEIVDELEENSKLMSQIDKGVVPAP